ncbi:MAG: glycosyltransferase family 4 protein [Planctomycetota bacterium]|jgi:glycosyltransferase involved in cell wall biosynthesis
MAENKPIRVCLVVPKAYPLFNREVKSVFGGAEVDCYFLATELAKDKDFDVNCIVADYGQDDSEVRQDVRIIKSLNFGENSLLGAWRVWRAMHRADAQIYFIETASPGVPLVSLFCKLCKRKFVYRTAHSRECDGTYLIEHKLLGKAFARSLRQADTVITQNDEDIESLRTTIGASSVVIRNAHLLPSLQRPCQDTILWAARSVSHKRPGLFINLARQFPREQFVMICPKATGDEGYDDLVAQAGEIANLEFVKQVPFCEMDSYFERAKVFVNTSDDEGYPNTFIEACKYRTPILSLNVNPDGFLDKNKCGMCACGDWQRFVDMFEQLLDEETAERYGDNGRRYAERKHDITKVIEEYKAIFRRLGQIRG